MHIAHLILLCGCLQSCGREQNLSTLQDMPPGLRISNHLPGTEGIAGQNDLLVRFGVDRGSNGFNATGPSYMVRPGSTTPILSHDFNRYPDFVIMNTQNQVWDPAFGGIERSERPLSSGRMIRDLDIGRDQTNGVLRQLREEEPIRFSPNLIATPAVPGFYTEKSPGETIMPDNRNKPL